MEVTAGSGQINTRASRAHKDFFGVELFAVCGKLLVFHERLEEFHQPHSTGAE